MKTYSLAYVLILVVFGWGIYATIQAGKGLETRTALPSGAIAKAEPNGDPAPPSSTRESGPAYLAQVLRENLHDPLSLLLVQLIAIVLLARIFGSLAVRMGQPAVIGEMIAGIALGPSLVGTLFPDAFKFLFPAGSLGALRMLSQVGVILFMYVVGMELDLNHLRSRAKTAVMVSHVSIVFPYFLGVVFSLFLFKSFAPANASFLSFALFMGIAMSVTAFPVLARILEERGLTRSHLGSTAITCAAIDDLTAWSILAVVIALVKAGGIGTSAITILLALVFIAAMVFGVKPLLNRFVATRPEMIANPSREVMVGILIIVFCSALFTEVVGIHAIFGAFLAGIAMPSNPQFRARLKDRLENFSSAFLLPLFFAFTGLRTEIGLLNDWQSWAVCGGLILVATAGKLGGSMITARLTGMNWHDSFALGALMNTRGLVELIVLNIGLDLGILSPRVFAMMVIMALVTTFMTGPLLSLGTVLRRQSLAQSESLMEVKNG
ncbi:MAG: cation/H(+) antiporter [Pedosphaera sp.]|nr:cation/H(+) antiporter [Pedosphaera sp.]